MPELPEVETICRGLAGHLVGRQVLSVAVRRRDLRLPIPGDFAERLTGRTVREVSRRAKYFLIHLDDDTVVVGHLGMSGRMYVQAAAPVTPAAAHDHVVFEMGAVPTGSAVRVVYHDPRRFGLLVLGRAAELDRHPLLKELGPEPLGPSLTPARMEAAVAGRRGPIKVALLDQTVVAGLGNIYVSEALYRAAISPLRAAGSLTRREWGRLVPAIRSVLRDAIDAGGSTLRDYVQADGEVGGFQNLFHVYDREGAACPRRGCRGSIRRIVQAARATYYCPRCQR